MGGSSFALGGHDLPARAKVAAARQQGGQSWPDCSPVPPATPEHHRRLRRPRRSGPASSSGTKGRSPSTATRSSAPVAHFAPESSSDIQARWRAGSHNRRRRLRRYRSLDPRRHHGRRRRGHRVGGRCSEGRSGRRDRCGGGGQGQRGRRVWTSAPDVRALVRSAVTSGADRAITEASLALLSASSVPPYGRTSSPRPKRSKSSCVLNS